MCRCDFFVNDSLYVFSVIIKYSTRAYVYTMTVSIYVKIKPMKKITSMFADQQFAIDFERFALKGCVLGWLKYSPVGVKAKMTHTHKLPNGGTRHLGS